MLEGAGECSKVRKRSFKYCWHLRDSRGPVTYPVKLGFPILIQFTFPRAAVSNKEVKGGRALEQFLTGSPEWVTFSIAECVEGRSNAVSWLIQVLISLTWANKPPSAIICWTGSLSLIIPPSLDFCCCYLCVCVWMCVTWHNKEKVSHSDFTHWHTVC